jgi:hypothetical protein
MNNKLEDEQRRRRGLKRSGPIVTTKVGSLGDFFLSILERKFEISFKSRHPVFRPGDSAPNKHRQYHASSKAIRVLNCSKQNSDFLLKIDLDLPLPT